MANETEVVEVRLPILPKGYRYTGEYRYAQQGELIMPRNDVFPWERVVESDYLHHIIEKIEDEIVYCFWFHEGVLVDASLKTYGRDSITVQIMGGSRKVGSYARST